VGGEAESGFIRAVGRNGRVSGVGRSGAKPMVEPLQPMAVVELGVRSTRFRKGMGRCRVK
jgi:hypothetical protein